MTYLSDRQLQKELAKLQIGATAAATLGSVIMAIGISMFVLSMGVNLEAIGEEDEKLQFYRIVGSGYQNLGLFAIFLGLGLVVVALGLINKKIDKLK